MYRFLFRLLTKSKMAIEDRLLPFLISHCHFECLKGPGDEPPKHCHAIVTY